MEKKKSILAGVALISIIAISAIFLLSQEGSNVLGFGGTAEAQGGNSEEYIKISVVVSSWKKPFLLGRIKQAGAIWLPEFGTKTTEQFWTIDGNKRDTASATITISITYQNIVANSLNVTIAKLWLEYSSSTSYIIDTTENSINGANTGGTVDKTYSDSKSVNTIASELSIPTDGGTYTVYNKFQVQVKGKGLKSGTIITADTGTSSCSPASNSWKYETEEVTQSTSSGSVSFSSWLGIGFFAGIVIALIIIAPRELKELKIRRG